MNRLFPSLTFLLGTVAHGAASPRTLQIPGIRMISVGGGAVAASADVVTTGPLLANLATPVHMGDPAGGATNFPLICQPADMEMATWNIDSEDRFIGHLPGNTADETRGGIRQLSNGLTVELRNGGETTQTVTLTVLSGSMSESWNSNNRSGTLTPDTVGASFTKVSNSTVSSAIAAHGYASFDVNHNCTAALCTYEGSIPLDGARSIATAGVLLAADHEENCFKLDTTTYLKLSVAEEYGSVTAVIFTHYGRISGRALRAITSPVAIAVNGGLPF